MRIHAYHPALLLLLTALAAAQVPLVAPVKEVPSDGSLLPAAFSGWKKAPGSQVGADPAKADASKAALLREAGLVSFERADYTRQGRTLKVLALRFSDATGASAAFSGMSDKDMAPEKFCRLAQSSGTRVLMACSNLVVNVEYDKITGMTPAEMRSLTDQLPLATGTAALPPGVPFYLPKDGLTDVRIALGSAGFSSTGSPIPVDAIDFSKGAEVAVGKYESSDGEGAVITLVKYPTPRIAAERLQAISQVSILAHSSERPRPSFITKRVGPIVVAVTGFIPESDARTLAEQVPYDVEITQHEPVYTPKDNIGNLVVNMLYLSFIVVGFTFVTGLALGAFRVLAKKYFPGRFVDRPEDVDFIKLDLRD